MSGTDGTRREPQPTDEELAELLRLARPRPVVLEEQLARLRASARVEWRRTVRRRRRQSAVALIGGLAAAAALAWALDLPSLFQERESPVIVGVVVHVRGEVRDVSVGAPPGGLRPAVGGPLRAGARLRTAEGRAALRWHDGTSLRLDADTRVHLESAAVVRLEAGAVYVDTGSVEAARSDLTVATPLGSASHLGTRYEVRLQGVGLRVRVRDGSVRLQSAGRTHAAAAGDELSVNHDGVVAQRRVPTYGPDWHWVAAAAPPFGLEGRSARALLEWAAAEGGWTLHFSDAALASFAANARLHGRVEGLSPEQALEVVLPTCGLAHRLEDGRLIVRRAGER